MATTAGRYLRVDIDDSSDEAFAKAPVNVGDDGQAFGLTLVDLHGRSRGRSGSATALPERMTAAIQERLQHLSSTDCVLVRWPWIAATAEEFIEEIETWLNRLSGNAGGQPVIPSGVSNLGVLLHRLGGPPRIVWARTTVADDAELCAQARSLELRALLESREAIWEPKTYHYRLPSGEHTDVFVRAADAFHGPEDVSAVVCWLTPFLVDGIGVVADTAGLTPLVLQIDNVLRQHGQEIGPTAILPQYPSGRPTVRRTVESVLQGSTSQVLALLSVSSTGGLQRLLLDELERAVASLGVDHCALEVLVDRAAQLDMALGPAVESPVRVSTWLGLARPKIDGMGAFCGLCGSAEKAQIVAIDPRSYGAMSLPEPHLVMPDIDYAQDAQSFWERAARTGGISIEANPHPASRVARGKRTPLPVRPIFELIVSHEGLEEWVHAQRIRLLSRGGYVVPPEANVGLVVAAENDLKQVPLPGFAGEGTTDLRRSLQLVLRALDIDEFVPILAEGDPDLRAVLSQLTSEQSVLIFSWGTVTGLTLRHIKVAVADELLSLQQERRVDALVLHSRPTSPREWSAMQNQFIPGRLSSLWTSCFPWQSPLQEEYRLLDRSGISTAQLSEHGHNFVSSRLQFLQYHLTYQDVDDDWSPRFGVAGGGPNPTHVFWGMSEPAIHQERVRGRSLYGAQLDCMAAYAAIGAAVNHTRLSTRPSAAPRWVMFELGRAVRSYFDAIITCALIRWLYPGELWWESDSGGPASAFDSVAFLIDQARGEPSEQVLLLPELLLAAAQGKIPTVARGLLGERVTEARASWPDEPGYDMARGAIDVGLWLLESN
ncbi:hypothetical protein [Candidatus Poriferisodalis sp.]|uniref:hypothetical protein n=1 Tax=Candidatus Poriferisodalis sp. TaxID=3101277 RepID=UPI003D125671